MPTTKMNSNNKPLGSVSSRAAIFRRNIYLLDRDALGPFLYSIAVRTEGAAMLSRSMMTIYIYRESGLVWSASSSTYQQERERRKTEWSGVVFSNHDSYHRDDHFPKFVVSAREGGGEREREREREKRKRKRIEEETESRDPF